MTSTAGELDRRVRQLVEAAARRDLTVRRRRLDRGDRSGRVEAAGDQLGGDRGPLRDAHEHDHRAADPGQGAPVDVGLAGAAVAGDDGEGRGDAAVGDGHAGGRGGGHGRGDAGHDLERDPGVDERLGLLAAPSEHERVAALEPDDPLPVPGERDEQGRDQLLGDRAARPLADVDQFGGRRARGRARRRRRGRRARRRRPRRAAGRP